MTPVLVFMIVVVSVAVLALAFAALQHRGASESGASWIGDVFERASSAVPTVADGDMDPIDEAEPSRR